MKNIEKFVLLVLPIIIGDLGALILGFLFKSMDTSYIISLYCMLVIIEWSFFIYIWIRLRSENVSIKEIYKREEIPIKQITIYGILSFCVFNGLVFFIFIYYTFIFPYPFKMPANVSTLILMVIIVPITAGICEETIWRAYNFWELNEEWDSKWKAILVSSISFGFFHGIDFVKIGLTIILGIAACLIYFKIKNLYPLIISHIIADMWSFFLTLFL